MTYKKCICCKETLAKTSFRRSQFVCKICESDPKSEYDKKCSRCLEFKSNRIFRKNRKYCRDCERSYGRKYRKSTNKAAIWVENNRERMTELQSNHYQKNKNEISRKRNERFKNDPKFRALMEYRRTIMDLFHGKSSDNQKMEIDRKTFLLWLKFYFSEEMCVKNHREVWQMDHVIPLDLTNTEKINGVAIEFDYSCVYSWYNIRPCLCAENHRKSKYIDIDGLDDHFDKIEKFVKKYKIYLPDSYDNYIEIYHIIQKTK